MDLSRFSSDVLMSNVHQQGIKSNFFRLDAEAGLLNRQRELLTACMDIILSSLDFTPPQVATGKIYNPRLLVP